MILTRTYLNARRQGARKLLASPHAMHAAVLSSFPPGVRVGRPLWRIDTDDPLRPALYLLSEERPDLTHVEEQAGWPSSPTTHSASCEPLFDSLRNGQTWAFRLKANPTHRAQIRDRSRIVAHVTVAQQIEWLAKRSEGLGIQITQAATPTFDVVAREMLRFRRDSATVTLGVATFEGRLVVSDREALIAAMRTGVGRAKAYGCGLMTLARP